jgi:hypothetical protein
MKKKKKAQLVLGNGQLLDEHICHEVCQDSHGEGRL